MANFLEYKSLSRGAVQLLPVRPLQYYMGMKYFPVDTVPGAIIALIVHFKVCFPSHDAVQRSPLQFANPSL